LAQEILDSCLEQGTWPMRQLDALVDRALDEDDVFLATAATRALFGIIVERLGDLFDPALCDVYARLFSYVIARARPAYNADDLLLRYRRVRQVRRFPGGEVKRALVLSRITLGADVAVTSVVLSALKERFPETEICLVGPEKNAEMFGADPRIGCIPVTYGRSGLLRDRLAAALELQSLVDETGAIVIDPDSRLTQLGLIPICDDSRYYFFESRAFGGALESSLPRLTAEWLSEVFDVPFVRPYVAPQPHQRIADITLSLGVGDNPYKRVDDEFEFKLVAGLLERGRPILLDRGAGGEEAARVDRLVERLGSPSLLHIHEGTYASFASHICQSAMYVGYDSAGQHVAAAANIPAVSVFSGYACARTLARWSPDAPRSIVVTVGETNRSTALERTLEAIAAAGAAAQAAPKVSACSSN
jgi:ADP-heptose:LPS heptosyltransferase